MEHCGREWEGKVGWVLADMYAGKLSGLEDKLVTTIPGELVLQMQKLAQCSYYLNQHIGPFFMVSPLNFINMKTVVSKRSLSIFN